MSTIGHNREIMSPAIATGIQWEDHLGELLLFDVESVEKEISTVHGVTDAVRCDIVILDGKSAGERHESVLVFPKALKAQLRDRVGALVAGRLGQGEAKKGQNAPWKLSEPTEVEKKLAMDYLAKTAAPPF